MPNDQSADDGKLTALTVTERIQKSVAGFVIGFIAGGAAGFLLHKVFLSNILSAHEDVWLVFGPSIILLIATAGIAVEVGVLSQRSTIHEREWWGRLAAWLLICGVTWTVVTGIAFYAEPAFHWLGWKVRLAIGSGALGISALAARIGNSPSGKNGGSTITAALIMRIGPACFVLAIAIGMSTFVRNIVLENANTDSSGLADSMDDTETSVEKALGDEMDVVLNRTFPWKLQDQLPIDMSAADKEGDDATTSEEASTASGTQPSRKVLLTRNAMVYPQVFGIALKKTRRELKAAKSTTMLWWFAGPILVACILGNRLDINTNSLNQAWANRIVRCYLGASNSGRKPHESTGFDDTDDVPLNVLLAKHENSSKDYDGPFHLINSALNVYDTEDLARQERHAESFVFSPLYCGYELANEIGTKAKNGRSASENSRGEFTKTGTYANHLTLGTAVSVSAAAAASQMGYHTMPSLAALMTVLNVRVGRWLPNPRLKADDKRLQTAGPRFGLEYLGAELFSRTNATSNYVYVSDGGHFENLGVYELIRRRVKFIVVIDGEADPNYEFHALGSIVRKARIDFGTDIQISAHPIQPAGVSKIRNPSAKTPVTLPDRLGAVNYALGLIHYPETDQAEDAGSDSETGNKGLMIYVKSSLIADDAFNIADVRQYAETHPTFPHESTADQFFSESQFESYRQLGQSVMSRVISEVILGQSTGRSGTGDGGTNVSSDDSGDERSHADEKAGVPENVVGEVMETDEQLMAIAKSLKPLNTLYLKQQSRNLSAQANVPLRQERAQKESLKESDALKTRQRQLAELVQKFREHCSAFAKPQSASD